IVDWDLLRVIAQGRKVWILEMGIRASTVVEAGASRVVDVGACGQRQGQRSEIRQSREKNQPGACVSVFNGVAGAAAHAVPVANRRTVVQGVHDAAPTPIPIQG